MTPEQFVKRCERSEWNAHYGGPVWLGGGFCLFLIDLIAISVMICPDHRWNTDGVGWIIAGFVIGGVASALWLWGITYSIYAAVTGEFFIDRLKRRPDMREAYESEMARDERERQEQIAAQRRHRKMVVF